VTYKALYHTVDSRICKFTGVKAKEGGFPLSGLDEARENLLNENESTVHLIFLL
jgi:hypothetical protein